MHQKQYFLFTWFIVHRGIWLFLFAVYLYDKQAMKNYLFLFAITVS